MKFRVGDRVKRIGKGDSSVGMYFGNTYTIRKQADDDPHFFYLKETGDEIWIDDLFKLVIGGTMSKYNDLKERISNVVGWTKKTDDIIREMCKNGKIYDFVIITHGDGVGGRICLFSYQGKGRNIYSEEEVMFVFSHQYSKNDAFKKALMWLLDHSDIKKDEKAEKIAELQDRMEDLQTEINNLK